MRRTTLTLILTLTLALTAFPALADDGRALRSGWTLNEAWSWLLDSVGWTKIGGATSDPDGPPAPPPAEEGGTMEDPDGNEAVFEGPSSSAGLVRARLDDTAGPRQLDAGERQRI